MATKYELITERYLNTAGEIAKPEVWPSFLTTACHNFRLSFDKQVLLYISTTKAACRNTGCFFHTRIYFRNVQTVRPRGRTNLQYTSKHRLCTPTKTACQGQPPETPSLQDQRSNLYA